MNAVLGIDTSCYRTSLALAGGGAILADVNALLEVGGGGRGLRQSEALFQHVTRLGPMIEALMNEVPDAQIRAVAVSTRPRPMEGSYMPVFLAGEMAARAVAASLRAALIETSHQQGHLRAALIGREEPRGDFLALHLSGGTTEVLKVGAGLEIELLGGTTDLNAGQLVDRVGVKMGLSFPAGPELERLAGGYEAQHLFPTANRGLSLSLSGAEAQALRMLDAGAEHGQVAVEVFSLIARSIAKLIDRASREMGLHEVLLGGGVASSQLLRSLLPARLERLGANVRLIWGEKRFSGDNAAGVALIGEERLRTMREETA